MLEWIDALWIPVLVLLLHKNQKLWAAGFVVCNMIMLRLMAELMVWIGYPLGMLPLIDMPLMTRGFILYSIINVLYLTIALYSPKSDGPMFMAMSISLFFVASVLFSVIMVL